MITAYFKEMADLSNKISVTDMEGNNIGQNDASEKLIKLFNEVSAKGNKLMIVGNGGSAAIASHQAIDYSKNGQISTLAFNDPSLLTCLSNDFGYEHVFAKAVDYYGKNADVLIAISSSGKSPNILNAVKSAREKKCLVVTLSGFSEDNPLRKAGDVNFFVPSDSYGYVEVSHLTILHCILDNIIFRREGG